MFFSNRLKDLEHCWINQVSEVDLSCWLDPAKFASACNFQRFIQNQLEKDGVEKKGLEYCLKDCGVSKGPFVWWFWTKNYGFSL